MEITAAALIATERGPAPLPEFTRRIMRFNEKVLQERREAFVTFRRVACRQGEDTMRT